MSSRTRICCSIATRVTVQHPTCLAHLQTSLHKESFLLPAFNISPCLWQAMHLQFSVHNTFIKHWKLWMRSCSTIRHLIASRLWPAFEQFDGESAPQPNPPRQKPNELREPWKLGLIQEWRSLNTTEQDASAWMLSTWGPCLGLSFQDVPGEASTEDQTQAKISWIQCSVLKEMKTSAATRNCFSCTTSAASVTGAALLRSFLGHLIASSALQTSLRCLTLCLRPVLGAFLCSDRSGCAGWGWRLRRPDWDTVCRLWHLQRHPVSWQNDSQAGSSDLKHLVVGCLPRRCLRSSSHENSTKEAKRSLPLLTAALPIVSSSHHFGELCTLDRQSSGEFACFWNTNRTCSRQSFCHESKQKGAPSLHARPRH